MKVNFNYKVVLGVCVFLCFLSYSTLAFDVKSFNQIANDTIKQVDTGVIGDIDTLITMQERLMVLGVEGGILFVEENPEEDVKALILVLERAEEMKNLSLEEFEERWHQGNYLRNKGVEIDKMDHFSETSSHINTIIHPATSYLLIKEYKETGNSVLLSRAKSELIEAVEHIKHVKAAAGIVMEH